MPVQVLRPNGIREDLVPRRTSIIGGAASREAAVSDESDATAVRRSAAGSPIAAFSLANPTPDGYPVNVITQGRTKANVSGSVNWIRGRMGLGRANGSSLQSTPLGTLLSYATSATRGYSGHTSRVQGGPWTWADLDDLLLVIDDEPSFSVSLDFQEAYVAVFSVIPATCSPVIVGTDPATSSFPKFDITVGNVVETWQAETAHLNNVVQIRVFSETEAGQPGFDPRASTEFIASGAVSRQINEYINGTTPSTSVVRWQTPTPLPASGTFRVYAWSRRGDGPDGPASYASFEMDVDPSQAPVIVSATALANHRIDVEIDLIPSAGHTSPKLALLERAVVMGDMPILWQWEPVPLYRYSDYEPTPGQPRAEVVDYTAPRGVPVAYRATMQTVKEGVRMLTEVSEISTPVTLDSPGWSFIEPVNFQRALNVRVVGEPHEDTGEDIAVFRPEGRWEPIVVRGARNSPSGEYRIITSTEQEWTVIRQILNMQRPVYVITGFGDTKWVSFIPPYGLKRMGTPTSPRREVTLSYVEMLPPEPFAYPAYKE